LSVFPEYLHTVASNGKTFLLKIIRHFAFVAASHGDLLDSLIFVESRAPARLFYLVFTWLPI
jgi:hypothetical protein